MIYMQVPCSYLQTRRGGGGGTQHNVVECCVFVVSNHPAAAGAAATGASTASTGMEPPTAARMASSPPSLSLRRLRNSASLLYFIMADGPFFCTSWKKSWKQGLTLVHFSAQLEPCLSQENTLHTLHTP